MPARPAPAAPTLTAFIVWAEMHDGSRRTLTVWGFGVTYQDRLADARQQVATHTALKGARIVNLRG